MQQQLRLCVFIENIPTSEEIKKVDCEHFGYWNFRFYLLSHTYRNNNYIDSTKWIILSRIKQF